MDAAPLNSDEALERFREIVLEDEQLLEQLRETADLESFAALTARLARQRGCALTSDEVRAAVLEARRAWLSNWI